MECLRLRVNDPGFNYNQIVVRDGKGNNDRVAKFHAMLKDPLKGHLEKVKAVHN